MNAEERDYLTVSFALNNTAKVIQDKIKSGYPKLKLNTSDLNAVAVKRRQKYLASIGLDK